MNALTKFFLVLLRLAIGWHLLFAGIAKFQPDYKGSEGYLQEAGGPAAPYFHSMIGDRLADRLAVGPESLPLDERFPPALDTEWKDYLDTFASHYNLTPEQRQKAEAKVTEIKKKAANWLVNDKTTITKPSPYGPPAEITKSVSEWVQDYQAKRQRLREEAANAYHFVTVPASLANNTRDRSAEKADVSRIRSGLTKELDTFTKEMKDTVKSASELTEEQTKKGSFPEPVKPPWRSMTHLDWIDFSVRWGLTIAGAGLILGFFTRLNCLGGALLLLSFYLAVPPLPGLPEAFRAEGYPFINKNIVEMLALLTLATTRCGRWAGVDGLLYYLNPLTRKTPEPRLVVPGRAQTIAPYHGTPTEGARATR